MVLLYSTAIASHCAMVVDFGGSFALVHNKIICMEQGKASSMVAAALCPKPGWEVFMLLAL